MKGMNIMTLDEAKSMMSQEAMNKLHEVVEVKPDIDFSHKVNNDILMTALCKAVGEGVIKPAALNDRLVKLLNSDTNTISQSKLTEILESIHKVQPGILCEVTMISADLDMKFIMSWGFYDEPVNFLHMFHDVLTYWNITPAEIRQKMTATLKPTIVNNVSQLVSKYYKSSPEDRQKMIVSISTIQRLVNMENAILKAEFLDRDKL
jgi:hypothetical protein